MQRGQYESFVKKITDANTEDELYDENEDAKSVNEVEDVSLP